MSTTMQQRVSSLCGDLDVEATPDAPLGPRTWYGIGGMADLLVRPQSVDALAALVKRCHRTRTPLRVLGSGANLLVADEGVDGVVVSLDAPDFKTVRYNREGSIHAVKVMAGADMARTLMDTVRQGFSGLTQMAGIPASIGGAIRMNAGGAFGSIGDAVREVTCLTRTGDVATYPKSEIDFGYRHTNIPDPIIISAVFELKPDDPIALRDRVKEIFAFKKSTQPLADHSAGCTFKNPYDPVEEKRISAGKLIDEAGLKGFTIGRALVSTQHANFIITQPGTRTDDVLKLLAIIKEKVFEDAGLELEEEVVIWRRGEGGEL